jgi:CsiD.
MSLEIKDHSISKRIKVIQIQETELDKLIFPFNKHSIQSLEYKPFSRFSLAKSVDDVFSGELSKALIKNLKDRDTGTTIVEPNIKNSKFDKDFLVKFSTALAYLIGLPNFDSMTGKYYARFHVKHSDSSDSYLRKAYTNMDLHTDGTYVKEKTDWLLMTKMEEN